MCSIGFWDLKCTPPPKVRVRILFSYTLVQYTKFYVSIFSLLKFHVKPFSEIPFTFFFTTINCKKCIFKAWSSSCQNTYGKCVNATSSNLVCWLPCRLSFIETEKKHFYVVFKSQLYIPFHQRMNPSLNTLAPTLAFTDAHFMFSLGARAHTKNIL